MYTPTITHLDDYSLALLGFAVSPPGEGIQIHRDVIRRQYLTAPIAGRDGVTLTDSEPVKAEREFSTVGTMTADTGANLLANYRAFCYRAGGNTQRRLRLVDDPSREILVVNTGITFNYLGSRIPGTSAHVECHWLALDPAWRDTTDTTVVLSTVGAACALGTEKSWGVVTINGASTPVVNPVIEYTKNAGTAIASITLTISLAAGETAIVDMDARWVKNAAGVITPSLRTAGNYFALDPYDDDLLTAVYPKLKLSATSGVPTGSVTYRKRWSA